MEYLRLKFTTKEIAGMAVIESIPMFGVSAAAVDLARAVTIALPVFLLHIELQVC